MGKQCPGVIWILVDHLKVAEKPWGLQQPSWLNTVGCKFVLNDLLHQTLISYNGTWFTFSLVHI